MSQRLAGKTILITGASSGIGLATAQEFSQTSPSIRLILAARRLSALETLAADLRTASNGATQVLPVQLDVSDASQVACFIDSLPPDWRNIDVLVNNAGLVKGVEHVGEIHQDDIDVMMLTNVLGLINLTNSVIRTFHARGGRGDIINIGSIAGREPYAGGSVYCASKAAVRSFSDALRRENVGNRIRVIEIDPGQVETEFSVVRFRGDRERARKVYDGVEPLTGRDVAEVVVFAAGRRENVVLADALVFPSHQAGAGAMYRKPS